MNTNGHKLNILFVTQEDPFYVKIFFEEFFKNCADRSEIKGMVISSTLGKKSAGKLAAQMLDFYGPVGFLKTGIRYVVNKILAQAARVIPFSTAYSLPQLCRQYGIPCQQRNDLNSPAFIDEWKARDIDVIISVASSVIFKEGLLKMPRWGCLNIHHAKLPRYRGMLPNFWQMYHDEKKAGITIHRMNPKIDDGEILLQAEIDVIPGETLDSLISRSKKAGAGLMLQVIDRIRSGNVAYVQNNAAESSYFTFPTAADMREFRRRGKRVL
jgi:methionyl-tRNA formyltransferase